MVLKANPGNLQFNHITAGAIQLLDTADDGAETRLNFRPENGRLPRLLVVIESGG